MQFGKPIGAFQLVQRKLVEMAIAVNTGSLMAQQLGRLKDASQVTFEQVSMAKLHNARAAPRSPGARSLLGATGITFDAPVIRHMNNLESVVTYEGTEEIHTPGVRAAPSGSLMAGSGAASRSRSSVSITRRRRDHPRRATGLCSKACEITASAVRGTMNGNDGQQASFVAEVFRSVHEALTAVADEMPSKDSKAGF